MFMFNFQYGLSNLIGKPRTKTIKGILKVLFSMFWVKFIKHVLPAGMHEYSKESWPVSNKL